MYLENQKKVREAEQEKLTKELEIKEQAKARALKHRKAQQDKIKAQIKDFNDKKEKERLD